MTTLHTFLQLKTSYEIQDIIPAQPNLIPWSGCNFTEDAVAKALGKIKVNILLVLIILHREF